MLALNLAFIVLWFSLFAVADSSLIASSTLSVMIKVFELIYGRIVRFLTDLENHKHEDSYYDSYLWKQFLFQTVNRYAPFFYLAINQKYSAQGCPKDGCLSYLRSQLVITLALLSLFQLVEVIYGAQFVRFQIWYEDYKERKATAAKQQERGGILSAYETEELPRSWPEVQNKWVAYGMDRQVDQMVQPVLSLGYVLIFGGVAPIIIPVCLLKFVLVLRANAWMLVHCLKRPVPQSQIGIGKWGHMIQELMSAGKLMNALLLVIYGLDFSESVVTTRVTGFILFYLGATILWEIADKLVPTTSALTEVMAARRKHVIRVINEKCAGCVKVPEVEESPRIGREISSSWKSVLTTMKPGAARRKSII